MNEVGHVEVPIQLERINPTDIPREQVVEYATKHRCTPMVAFSALLSKDLLERIDMLSGSRDLKIILRVLVENVIGNGKVK